ncbi:hypothetical protein [uncultured Treponema sp.]|uniref:hypothetical protein n=1 Tax=uncultured Treponema sp. TaxID=162155 RepID=UPI0025D43486|nr:hypothetical protein [uncultured Treponema sp.]
MDWSVANVLVEIGLCPEDFYDNALTVIMKKPCFDIFKFDDFLHSAYGDYEAQGKSMADVLHERYPAQEQRLKELFLF